MDTATWAANSRTCGSAEYRYTYKCTEVSTRCTTSDVHVHLYTCTTSLPYSTCTVPKPVSPKPTSPTRTRIFVRKYFRTKVLSYEGVL
eukprot:28626-Pelagococcus_subviridis.AAC.1